VGALILASTKVVSTAAASATPPLDCERQQLRIQLLDEPRPSLVVSFISIVGSGTRPSIAIRAADSRQGDASLRKPVGFRNSVRGLTGRLGW
jgi:hypothetical protein